MPTNNRQILYAISIFFAKFAPDKRDKKFNTDMRKVFLMAALVLACTTSSLANETLAETSNESMLTSLPVKKTTKKKTTTKKATTTTKKTATTKTATSTPSTAQSSSQSTAKNVLGEILSGAASSSNSKTGSVISSILDNVIGTGTFKQADLCAYTWKYKSPGCAFTSENLLAKAGGEIASKKIETKLSTYYKKAGFSSSNTYFKFNEDGSFESKIDGRSWKGTYTFDEKTHAIHMKGLLLSISGFATKNTTGVSLLFESKKLLTLVQTLTALSGNSTLSAIGNISKSYDGVRVGFDLAK